MAEDIDDILAEAWTLLAPNRDQSSSFPRGFWPDLARVAVEIALGQTPAASWCPTRCVRGSYPKPQSTQSAKKTRAENTAALLAKIEGFKL